MGVRIINVNAADQVFSNAGGGAASFITLYEGEATTTQEQYGVFVELPIDYEVKMLAGIPVKVTFEGTEYTTETDESGNFGAPFDPETSEIDFSVMPFSGAFNGSVVIIDTETAGTYQIKIEIQEYIQLRTVTEA